ESGVAAQAKDHPLPYYRPSSPPSAAEVRERSRSAYLLTPPKLDPRIVALAQELRVAATVDGTVNVERLIASVLAHFRREGFVYTLQPGEMGPNGTATFLFEKKRGFCGHYSNAFSLLIRLAGVPSRVVVGYYGGEINPIGGFMIVRQSNAHAWSEVWVEGSGWQRVDATAAAVPMDDEGNVIPPEAQADRRAFTASNLDNTWLGRRLKGLRDRWDFVESKWDRWAMGYDAETLSSLLARSGLQRLGGIGITILVLASCGLLVGGVVLGMRRRRRARAPEITLYDTFCRRLERIGVVRGINEGPLDFARRSSARVPAQAERIDAIAGAYVAIRYGGEPGARREGLARLARDLRAFNPRRQEVIPAPAEVIVAAVRRAQDPA
nr:DUF4129 domain-containing protein [Planctomycetota bacterium]